MSAPSLKATIQQHMKDAMKARDQERLNVIRMILAAIKQREVDEQITLDDTQTLAVIEKMLKQRRDSFEQFQNAGREDLAKQEAFEIEILKAYLPEQLSENEIDELVKNAVSEAGASSMKDMGKIMGILKPQMQGRADMGAVSGKIKKLLGA